MNDLTKNILLWVVIAVVLLTVFSNFSPRTNEAQDLAYSAFLQEVRNKSIDSVVIKGKIIEATSRDGKSYRIYSPETDNSALIGLLDMLFNPLWAWIGVGEVLAADAVIGGGIIVAAVVLAVAGRRRPQPALAPSVAAER